MPDSKSEPSRKAKIIYIISLVLAIWFLLFGWVWTYYANLFIAYPFGIIAFFLWLFAKKYDRNNKLNPICIRIILTGLFLSLITLFTYR